MGSLLRRAVYTINNPHAQGLNSLSVFLKIFLIQLSRFRLEDDLMEKFFNFSKKRFAFAFACLLLSIGCLFISQTPMASTYYAMHNLYKASKDNWVFLNTRYSQQNMPEEVLLVTSELEGASRTDVFRELMSVRKKITYENTPIESTLTPQEFFKRTKGDCDDIAYMWYHQLWSLGIPSKVLFVSMHPKGSKPYLHAVTLTEDDAGQLVVLDVNSLFFIAQPFDSWRKNYNSYVMFEAYGETFKRADSMFTASLF